MNSFLAYTKIIELARQKVKKKHAIFDVFFYLLQKMRK